MKITFRWPLSFLVFLILALGQNAFALPVARLKNVKPVVEVQKGRTQTFMEVHERDGLNFGDTIRTRDSGKAGIWFSNGTKAFLSGPNARLQIVAPTSPNTPLTLRITGALSRVFVRPKGLTYVQTAAAIAAAPGTEYLLEISSENTTVVTVLEGTVELFNPQGRVIVNANEQSQARIGGAPTPPIAVDVTGLVAWTADINGLPIEFETPFVTFAPKQQNARLQIAQALPNRVESLQKQGEAHYDGGDYATAAAEFSEASRLAPQNTLAQFSLGRARQAEGDIPGAIHAYQTAQKLATEDPLPRIGEALALMSKPAQARGDEEGQKEALADHQAARAVLTPVDQNPMAQAVLGLLELREGNSARASELLQTATERDPKLYQAHALLALALLSQNHIPQAAQSAHQAVMLSPDSAQAQGTLAMVLFFQKRIKEATGAARKAVALNPYSPFALLAQGRVYLAQLRVAEARDAFQQAQSLAPGLPLVPAELGTVYARLDRLPQAELQLRRALVLMPNSADAHTQLGQVLQRQGHIEEALSQHQEALRLDPRNVSARVNLATLFLDQGRLQEAREQIEQGIGDESERGILYVQLSEITLLQRQDVLGAEVLARRGVQLLPDSALSHYQLGRILLEENRLVQAEQEFRQATILDRQFADSRFALGFTKALTEPKNDALPSPNNTDLGSISRVVSLLNLQSVGNEERIQAAIQDPTVFRIASRAYGDTQFDTITGGLGTQNLRLSHLQESGNRRGEVGIIAERESNDGVRLNTDETTNRLSTVAGLKATSGPSGWFFLGQIARQEKGLNGLDVGGLADIATARRETRTPLLIAGYNSAPDETRRTRALLQYSQPSSHTDGLQNGSDAQQNLRNFSLEVRHDVQMGLSHWLSAGFSLGRSRLDQASLLLPAIPTDSTFRNLFGVTTRTTQFYLRDEWKINERLALTGELQYQKANANGLLSIFDGSGNPLFSTQTSLTKGVFLPAFIMDYRLNKRSGLRFRARRTFGNIREFQLLSPLDEFASSTSELPDLSLTGRGISHEMEYDHTWANSSFLRLGIFDQNLRDAQDALLNPIPRARLRGARLGYSGLLNHRTSFFVNGSYNRARNVTANRAIDNVPSYSADIGFQYLNHSGWFLQPSFTYNGRRPTTDSNNVTTKLGGFSLWNLEIGKRWGLRSALSVGVNNIFNKKYALFAPTLNQPNRKFYIGATQRF
ncbi:hypothetical protein IAD21_05967 [Abditibacteriota bacterium]|nr:hypothetical protein IAD21_05967 [Abditibacteriota bacterium]